MFLNFNMQDLLSFLLKLFVSILFLLCYWNGIILIFIVRAIHYYIWKFIFVFWSVITLNHVSSSMISIFCAHLHVIISSAMKSLWFSIDISPSFIYYCVIGIFHLHWNSHMHQESKFPEGKNFVLSFAVCIPIIQFLVHQTYSVNKICTSEQFKQEEEIRVFSHTSRVWLTLLKVHTQYLTINQHSKYICQVVKQINK